MGVVYTFKQVIEEQKKSLDYKIEKAKDVIREAFLLSTGGVSIAFSGGKDSTVLWHLVRTCFPDAPYHVIFGNTTLEFPESLKFARKLGKEWSNEKVRFHEVLPERLTEDGLKYEAQKEVMEWLEREGRIQEVLKEDGKLKSTRTLEKAATLDMWEDFRKRGLVWKKGTRKAFHWCVDQYGYPILGKAASKLTARRINIDCFLKYSESGSEKKETLEYYELIRHVKTSNHCCSILKKEPSEKKQAELGIDVVLKGLLAEESHSRLLSFATRGYIYESSRPHADKFYHVSPLGIWKDRDIWEYIHKFHVPYSPLYDLEYKDRDGNVCRIKRNGCVGCCTDIAFPKNHMSVLRQTHPKHWEYQMKTGLGEELMKLYKYKGNGRVNYLSLAKNIGEAVDMRPCAFDDIGERIIPDWVTKSRYDSEIEGQMNFEDYLEELEKGEEMEELQAREENNWWKEVSYEEAKTYIETNIKTMARSFIAVGYYLKQIRDRELFREEGYGSVWEFAEKTYGMSRTTASRWMEMNNRFSESGDSPVLAEKYQGFGRSQLQEMLYLPEEKLEETTADMTVKQIRELGKLEEGGGGEKRTDEEEKENFVGLRLCITGASGSGHCGTAAYCIEPYDCCAKCQESCNIRCGWIKGQKESEQAEQMEEKIDLNVEKEEPDTKESSKTHPEPEWQQDAETCVTSPAESDGRQDAESGLEKCATSHMKGEPAEGWEKADENLEMVLAKLLKKEKKTLKKMETTFAGMPDDGIPPVFTEQKIMVKALELLAEFKEAAEKEALSQPPLPVMKNNDQRKDWLRGYREWGLWYKDEHIGASYYKYDFENGARLIVEEYTIYTKHAGEHISSYYHLVGGPVPEWSRSAYGYKWQRHEKYDRFANSEGELVEFLKYIQKKTA